MMERLLEKENEGEYSGFQKNCFSLVCAGWWWCWERENVEECLCICCIACISLYCLYNFVLLI